MEKKVYRSDCPIAGALDVIGDKWTLLIVRDLLLGKSKYGEFAESAESIPTNILASRLKALVSDGLVERIQYSERPPRYEYRLSAKGARLKELIVFLRTWGEENLNKGDGGLKP